MTVTSTFLLDFANGVWQLHGLGGPYVTELEGDFDAALAQAFGLIRDRAPCELQVRPNRAWRLATVDGEWEQTQPESSEDRPARELDG